MHKIRTIWFSVVMAGLILACSLTGAPAAPTVGVSTIVAATINAIATSAPAKPSASVAPTQALPAASATETAQPSAGGVPISSANVNFVIPAGLASNAVAETVPAVDEQSGAPWEVAPAYLKFTLQDYPLHDQFFQPKIAVYPAQDYAAVGAGAAISIQRLQAILASPNAPLSNDILPRLPYANADQIFAAQPQIISFKNGSGVRVLTEYAQGLTPIDNHDLFYHFEGLTSDGKYYVVATLPVNAVFLPANSDPNSPVPPGGISFPGYTVIDGTTYTNYIQTVTNTLNAANPDSFTPPVEALDALIQSLSVQ